MRTPRKMLWGALVVLLVAFFSGASTALAQQPCPRPARAAAVTPPSVTAPQVEAGTGDLREFALAARDYLDGFETAADLIYSACLFRNEEDWRSGSTYVVTMSPDGRIIFHSDMAALSGRRLENRLYRSIAQAVGLSPTGMIGNPDGGLLPGGGYAAGYSSFLDGTPLILIAGLDIRETHLAQETVDPGSPAVRADQVVDRASLKAFVDGATDYLVNLYRTEGRGAFAKAKSVFRDPSGPWRHGPVYLFIMEPSGYTIFHGAFPDKFEFRAPTGTLRDEVTGDLILPQIIRTARAPGGGFVRYYFDNPDDDTDRADVPKVSYARQHVFEGTAPDGNAVAYPLIFGAGIYGDPSTVSEEVCPAPPGVAANPLAVPGVTAVEAAVDPGSLPAFATAAKDYLDSITTPEELGYAGCLMRNEGPWKAGSTYLASVSLDGRTLKKFVNGAIDYLLELNRTRPTEAIGIARSILRRPPWRNGPVYLFVMDDKGYTHLHAAFPDRFEFQKPTDTLRDEVTGQLILPQIIEVAKKKPDGGFVQYYFDNPNDDSDSADVPKVTYAREVEIVSDIPGVGRITNSIIFGSGIYGDPVSEESVASTRGWLARFGRAAAGQAVEMISGRLNSPAPAGTKVVLAGHAVNPEDDPAPSPGQDGLALTGKGGLAPWHGTTRPGLMADSPIGERGMSLADLLARSSFRLSAAQNMAGSESRGWTAWGGGALTTFEGGGAAAIEGDVTTGMLGVDFEKGGLVAGAALSHARGKGGFQNEGRSEMEATLTSVYPYLRFALTERISAWGILGVGQGEMTLDEQTIEKVVETDIEMRMGAAGVRGVLLSAAQAGGFDLALKADFLTTQVDADAKDGLEAITAETRRFRAMVEGSREIAMGGGGTVRPSLEMGLRHDGGDVDEGMGMELGGSIRFASTGGLTIELNARALLTHEEEDVKDWGAGGLLRLDPGQAGRGLAFTVEPSTGRAASGAARLWGLRDASRLADEGAGIEPRVRAEVGYGVDAMGGILTPYTALSLSERGSRTYRVGGRFKVREGLSMSLEGDRGQSARDGKTSHGVVLQGSIHW